MELYQLDRHETLFDKSSICKDTREAEAVLFAGYVEKCTFLSVQQLTALVPPYVKIAEVRTEALLVLSASDFTE